MAGLIIPKSVGGDADVDVSQRVEPIEQRASSLVIPASVGGVDEKRRLQNQEVEAQRIRQQMLDELSAEIGPMDAAMISAGRGLTTIGRGLGLVEPESPDVTRAFENLEEKRPIATTAGEIVGQAAPFLAPGMAVGAIPGFFARIAASVGLGATEGGAIVRGEGGDFNETLLGAGAGGTIAGIAEAVFPVLGRLGRKIIQRTGRSIDGPLLTKSGSPTPEFQRALKETGTSFDDLTQDAIDFVAAQRSGAPPEEVSRLARFKSLDMPATRGDVSQEFADQAIEQRLLSQAAAESGEPLRQLKLKQSETLKTRINELVDALGVSSEAGDTLKTALEGRKKLLRTEKNDLYRQVSDTAPEIANIPLLTGEIASAIPKPQELRRLSRLAGNQVDAVKDLMVEFGIDKSDEALEEFAKTGGEVTPLSVGNFEDFRQALNQIDRADTTGAASVVIGPIRNALDAEATMIDDALKASGNVSAMQDSTLDVLKQARDRVRTLKTEFSPQSITGRLIDVKRDGVTPVIEASKVTQQLLSPNAPIENLERTLKSLSKAGDKGKKAIGDLRASVVLNALEDSLKAPSRKTSGIETIGGNQFAKSLSKFGDDKLELLFKGDKKGLNRLKNLKQAALDISPSAAATPKGSASVILDLAKKAGRLPGIAAVVDVAKFIITAGSDDRAVSEAMKNSPKLTRQITAIQNDFPQIAAALGIAGIAQINGEQ